VLWLWTTRWGQAPRAGRCAYGTNLLVLSRHLLSDYQLLTTEKVTYFLVQMKLNLTKTLVSLSLCYSEWALQWSVRPYAHPTVWTRSISAAPVSPDMHFITSSAVMRRFTHSAHENTPLCWHQWSQAVPNIPTCILVFVLACFNSPSFSAKLWTIQIANMKLRVKSH
jgi:hypothetical protein